MTIRSSIVTHSGEQERHSADRADGEGHFKGQRGCALPEDSARESRRDDHQIPDPVIDADCACPPSLRRQVDDERFACRLTDLLESSKTKGRYKRREARGKPN